MRKTEVTVGFGELRFQPDTRTKFSFGTAVVAGHFVEVQAETSVAPEVIGVQADGLSKFDHCVLLLPLRLQGPAEAAVSAGEVGLQLDRLTKLCDRFVELSLVVQGVAEVLVGQGIIGLELDRQLKLGDCLPQLALLAKGCRRGYCVPQHN